MMRKRNILFVLLFISSIGSAQLYLPNSPFYNAEIERLALDTNISSNFFNRHLSMKPILDKRTFTDSLYAVKEKYYYWITQKLFKENFIIFKGNDFWCSIDPIIDLEVGTDFSADSLERLYWNTRGIRIQGAFLEKVGFSTSIYENQAMLPVYQQNYANSHGEFFPNSDISKYQQNNAVIPGYARTKQFKKTGYDFTFAEGYINYIPSKHINFQLGNGNHFIGNGYRSLLLSDFTVNYPYAKIETNLLNGRIQYNAIYAIHQNLYRLVANTTPEATYEKKIGTYHYLDFTVTENFQIGVFEGNLWNRVDSTGSHQPDFLFTNPLPLINTFAKGFENTGFKAIIGFNAAFSIGKNVLYTQAIIDQKKISGFQAGIKFYDLILPKLDGGIEFNHVALNTYLSTDKRYNYSHYNLPLAHPYINGFSELTIHISYQYKHFFVQNRFNYSQRIKNDSISIGNAILSPSSTLTNNQNQTKIVVYNQFEIGYRFNKRNNLQVFIGHLYRNASQPTNTPLTNYAFVGLRTRIKNKYLDY